MSSKLKRKIPLANKPKPMPQMSKELGVKLQNLMDYNDDIHRQYQKEYQEKLYRSEDVVALANILISLLAINKVWGYKGSMRRWLDEYDTQRQYVETVGIRKAFEEVMALTGGGIEFDDFDVMEMIRHEFE